MKPTDEDFIWFLLSPAEQEPEEEEEEEDLSALLCSSAHLLFSSQCEIPVWSPDTLTLNLWKLS